MPVFFTALKDYVRDFYSRWRYDIYLHNLMLGAIAITVLFTAGGLAIDRSIDRRSFGGWDDHPNSERCYKQERIATLLAFWLGVLGIDQWYARHWILAVFKTATLGGLGVWAVVDINLWIIGGVYGTPGCPGGSKKEWLY